MTFQPTSRKPVKGWVLLLGLSVVGPMVFSVLSLAQEAPAVPSEADTATAVAGMRTINTAEVTYASTYNKGFSAALKHLGGPEDVKPTATASALVDEKLAAGKKANYVFTYKPGKTDKDGKITTYTVTARPAKWVRGDKSFFSDQTGVIRWTDENRPPKAGDPPLQ